MYISVVTVNYHGILYMDNTARKLIRTVFGTFVQLRLLYSTGWSLLILLLPSVVAAVA